MTSCKVQSIQRSWGSKNNISSSTEWKCCLRNKQNFAHVSHTLSHWLPRIPDWSLIQENPFEAAEIPQSHLVSKIIESHPIGTISRTHCSVPLFLALVHELKPRHKTASGSVRDSIKRDQGWHSKTTERRWVCPAQCVLSQISLNKNAVNLHVQG